MQRGATKLQQFISHSLDHSGKWKGGRQFSGFWGQPLSTPNVHPDVYISKILTNTIWSLGEPLRFTKFEITSNPMAFFTWLYFSSQNRETFIYFSTCWLDGATQSVHLFPSFSYFHTLFFLTLILLLAQLVDSVHIASPPFLYTYIVFQLIYAYNTHPWQRCVLYSLSMNFYIDGTMPQVGIDPPFDQVRNLLNEKPAP